MSVKITNEMLEAAKAEAEKREAQEQISHHFSLEHLDDRARNILGFIGEFAGRDALGLDWREGIRGDYLTPDEGDIISDQCTVDIKTETIPGEYFQKIVRRRYDVIGKEICKNSIDDGPYGRRLICEDQVALLTKYNFVLWCAFEREKYQKWVDNGYPVGKDLPECYILGYCDTEFIRKDYQVRKDKPYGTGGYPVSCLAVRTSDLQHFQGLRNIVKK